MKTPWCVLGLGYGDEGKGTCVDALSEKIGSKLTVRFNGGAQASHRVERGALKHSFHQFGSATFQGIPTYLGPRVMVNPLALQTEARELGKLMKTDVLPLMYVDEDCRVTTTFHMALNLLKEIKRGSGRHGSCGMGIGETVRIPLLSWRHLGNHDELRSRLVEIRKIVLSEIAAKDLFRDVPDSEHLNWIRFVLEPDHDGRIVTEIEAALEVFPHAYLKENATDNRFPKHVLKTDAIVFEGAQGVLLDETYGKQPHTTWSDCTNRGARALLGSKADALKTIGVVRTYMTRHGEGPLWQEIHNWPEPDLNNPANAWQGDFRYGEFDEDRLKYALKVSGGVDYLAVTHCDSNRGICPASVSYRLMNLPIAIASYGSDSTNKTFDQRILEKHSDNEPLQSSHS